MTSSQHVYEVTPRKDNRGAHLMSDVLSFGRLWYSEPNAIGNAVDYAKFRSRSHNALIRVYDEAGNVIENARASGRFQRAIVAFKPLAQLPGEAGAGNHDGSGPKESLS